MVSWSGCVTKCWHILGILNSSKITKATKLGAVHFSADNFDNNVQAMEKGHQEIVTKLERVEEETISKMRNQHQNTVATMKNQHQDMVAKMENQHQDLMGKMAVKHQELEEEKEEFVTTIRLLEERLANKVPFFLIFWHSFSDLLTGSLIPAVLLSPLNDFPLLSPKGGGWCRTKTSKPWTWLKLTLEFDQLTQSI